MKNKSSTNQRPGILRFSIKFFQILLFIPIQILFIPFFIMGLAVGLYKEMGVSKKLGVSFSAGQALQYRWFMHYLESRPDPLSVAFVRKFPCESHFGLWTTMGALIMSQRLFGFRTRLSRVAEPEKADLAAVSGTRVVTFDRIIEKYLEDMDQIVFPGAGFDLIALRYTEGKNIKVYELDQVSTQKVKLETLEKASLRHDWITYIPVDYEKESWTDKLLEAGFDKTGKTLFLWQSVSLYLDGATVRDALKSMADLCTQGSVIAQDFYSLSYSSGEYSSIARRNMSLIEKMGEPTKFGINMGEAPKESVESFLKECGLRMTNYIQFGKKLDVAPFYCIVEAEKDDSGKMGQ